jgi:hypothetical protein
MEGVSWRTTPLAIAEKISRGLADTATIAKVNGEVSPALRSHIDFGIG